MVIVIKALLVIRPDSLRCLSRHDIILTYRTSVIREGVMRNSIRIARCAMCPLWVELNAHLPNFGSYPVPATPNKTRAANVTIMNAATIHDTMIARFTNFLLLVKCVVCRRGFVSAEQRLNVNLNDLQITE